MSAASWLRANGYGDIADLIDEVEGEWLKAGKRTRRDWWDILSGDARGDSRLTGGRVFPVLWVAQVRQGKQPTKKAIKRNRTEVPPVIRKSREPVRSNKVQISRRRAISA